VPFHSTVKRRYRSRRAVVRLRRFVIALARFRCSDGGVLGSQLCLESGGEVRVEKACHEKPLLLIFALGKGFTPRLPEPAISRSLLAQLFKRSDGRQNGNGNGLVHVTLHDCKGERLVVRIDTVAHLFMPGLSLFCREPLSLKRLGGAPILGLDELLADLFALLGYHRVEINAESLPHAAREYLHLYRFIRRVLRKLRAKLVDLPLWICRRRNCQGDGRVSAGVSRGCGSGDDEGGG
jgi:hypothetical protein